VTLGTADLDTIRQPTYTSIQLAAEGSGGGGLTPLLLLLGLGAFTYLILVRPQRNRMKQMQRTQASLTPGAEVMTTAGMYATVVRFDDDSVTLETAPGVHNRYARAAVARIVTSADATDDSDDVISDESTDDEDSDDRTDDDEAPEDASRPQR